MIFWVEDRLYVTYEYFRRGQGHAVILKKRTGTCCNIKEEDKDML